MRVVYDRCRTVNILFKILIVWFFIISPLGSLTLSSHAQISTKPELHKRTHFRQLYDSLTKDWGGARSKLEDWGVSPGMVYYTTILGNPVGGERKGVEYAGRMTAHLDFDLEKLLGISGTSFVVSGAWTSGRSLSGDKIGNFFLVSEVFGGGTVNLYHLFLESVFFDGRFNIAAGRLSVGDEFATSTIYYDYVSNAINGYPISIAINDDGFFSDTVSSWGARTIIEPLKGVQFMAGVYNSNPEVARDSARGVDFSFEEGAILISQLSYLRTRESGHEGLPGALMLGGFYDTKDFDFLDGSGSQEGNYGFYAHIEQMIYRESGAGHQGLTPWVSATLFPDQDINTFPYFINGGAVYRGPFNGRDRDTAAFGFAYGTLSDELRGKDFEIMFELTYIIQATGWLQIQPDLQYIVHPGGSAEIPNALVIGFQLGLIYKRGGGEYSSPPPLVSVLT